MSDYYAAMTRTPDPTQPANAAATAHTSPPAATRCARTGSANVRAAHASGRAHRSPRGAADGSSAAVTNVRSNPWHRLRRKFSGHRDRSALLGFACANRRAVLASGLSRLGVPRARAARPVSGPAQPGPRRQHGRYKARRPAHRDSYGPDREARRRSDAVNEATPGSQPPAQLAPADGKKPKPAFDKSDESSSKHKKKKGLAKLNPF